MKIRKLSAVLVLGLGATLALVWLLSFGSLPVARAASFTVDTNVDEFDGECTNDCSLRDAIILANGNGEADVITLGSDTYILTITGIDEDAGETGDLDITAPLTITGLGPGQTVIDASGIISDRALDIRLGVSTVAPRRVEGRTPRSWPRRRTLLGGDAVTSAFTIEGGKAIPAHTATVVTRF